MNDLDLSDITVESYDSVKDELAEVERELANPGHDFGPRLCRPAFGRADHRT